MAAKEDMKQERVLGPFDDVEEALEQSIGE